MAKKKKIVKQEETKKDEDLVEIKEEDIIEISEEKEIFGFLSGDEDEN